MKRTIHISLALVLAMAMACSAALAGDVETVEITGQAAIMDDDKAHARDQALRDAQRKAVESAVGTMVSSETVTENYQLISDRIYAKADGYVQKFKILDEKEDGGVMIVEIKAWVSRGAIENDLQGLLQLMKAKNMPKVIVMVAEQNVGMDGPAYWWDRQGRVSIDMRVIEAVLMGEMRQKGFEFVDTEVLEGKKTIAMPVSKLSDKQAMRIAKTTDAEIIIVGQAVAIEQGKYPGTQSIIAKADVTLRVINTDNGRIITSAMVSGNGRGFQAKSAGNSALKVAGKNASKKLVKQIADVWKKDVAGTNLVRMTVKGFKNRKHLTQFLTVIRNRVRTVADAREKKYSRSKTLLELDVVGKTRDLATELEAKDFGGDFKIEVTSVSDNAIGIKLLP